MEETTSTYSDNTSNDRQDQANRSSQTDDSLDYDNEPFEG